jgi:outer membrane lipoprotein-sorting protein
MARPLESLAAPRIARRVAEALGAALSLFGALALAAASPLAAGEERAHAAAVTLDDLLRDMASTPGVSAQFSERKELALLSAPLESSGWLYFVPPDRFARFTEQPAFSALVIDGERVRFREGDAGDELDLSGNPMTRAFVENFIALWSGDRTRLERLYEARLTFEGERWELALTPRRAPLSRFIEVVSLRGSGDVLEQMTVRDRDGDRTATTFRSVRRDRAFSADELERLFARGMPLEGAAGGR